MGVWHIWGLEKPVRAARLLAQGSRLDVGPEVCLHSCLMASSFYVTVERRLPVFVTLAFKFNKLYYPDTILPRRSWGNRAELAVADKKQEAKTNLKLSSANVPRRYSAGECWGESRNRMLLVNHGTTTLPWQIDLFHWVHCGIIYTKNLNILEWAHQIRAQPMHTYVLLPLGGARTARMETKIGIASCTALITRSHTEILFSAEMQHSVQIAVRKLSQTTYWWRGRMALEC